MYYQFNGWWPPTVREGLCVHIERVCVEADGDSPRVYVLLMGNTSPCVDGGLASPHISGARVETRIWVPDIIITIINILVYNIYYE